MDKFFIFFTVGCVIIATYLLDNDYLWQSLPFITGGVVSLFKAGCASPE